MAATGRPSKAGGADRWPVRPSRGGPIGLATAAGLLLIGAFGLGLATRQPLGWPAALGVLAASLFIGAGIVAGLVALGYYRLAYRFAPGALIIEAAGAREVIALPSVEGIYAGQRVGTVESVRGLNWPG